MIKKIYEISGFQKKHFVLPKFCFRILSFGRIGIGFGSRLVKWSKLKVILIRNSGSNFGSAFAVPVAQSSCDSRTMVIIINYDYQFM